jgi:hypothetical protein
MKFKKSRGISFFKKKFKYEFGTDWREVIEYVYTFVELDLKTIDVTIKSFFRENKILKKTKSTEKLIFFTNSYLWIYTMYIYTLFLSFNNASFFYFNANFLIFLIFSFFFYFIYVYIHSYKINNHKLIKFTFFSFLLKLKSSYIQALYFIKYFYIYNNLILLKNLLIFLRSFFLLISFENILLLETNLSLDSYSFLQFRFIKWL